MISVSSRVLSLSQRRPAAALHAPEETHCSEKALLTGLADCLPTACYDENYLD